MADRSGIEWTGAMRDRFWSKVASGPYETCWPWTAGCFSNGYGQFRVGKRKVKTHRVAYELSVGPIPADRILRHSCDNPPCCNPGHLLANDGWSQRAIAREIGISASQVGNIVRGASWRI